MVNYQKGKIYRIVSNHTDQVYIGSTCNPLSKRMAKHRCDYKRYVAGNRLHKITSFDILQYDDAAIVLIEDCPCENKDQLSMRERFHIESTPNCVNKQIPGRTLAEYLEDNTERITERDKIYREKNSEKIKEYKKTFREENQVKVKEAEKAWREDNKAKIAERDKAYYEANKVVLSERSKGYYEANKAMIGQRQNEKIVCECGSTVSKVNMPQHKKTKKHQNILAVVQ